MRPQHPYIGLTGFTASKQIKAALDAFGPNNPTRLLMLGFLQTHKSLQGIPLNHPWDKRTPTLDNLSDLLPCDSRCLTMVHYARGNASDDEVLEDLKLIAQEAGLCLDGFQLNMVWPDPALLKFCRDRREVFPRSPRFVIQITQKALAQAGGTYAGVMKRLEAYEGLAHYALFDMSGGLGKPLDPAQALEFLRAHRDSGLTLNPIVAGGIGPSTLNLLRPILAEFPHTSTDMEGACMVEDGALSIPLLTAAIRGIVSMTK
jgi:hypothetical protein